ncbi:Ubiquitin domain-containing protein [Paramyrothecium foliicola]|nr:Ubiquitin domain-containing protein [Paramyrothecium foliicola]
MGASPGHKQQDTGSTQPSANPVGPHTQLIPQYRHEDEKAIGQPLNALHRYCLVFFAPRRPIPAIRLISTPGTMGCCVSRSTGPNSPYPGGAANASARAINPPPLSLPESVQSSHPESQPRRRRDPGPLDQHINRPLRRHHWSSKNRRWTKAQLAQERAEFFDTRVTGRPEIWQTIHAALQVLWEPELQEDGSDGLATAQTILTAAEISLPTGNIANGVYDSLGNLYQLPEWAVSDPDNVVDDADPDAKGELAMAGDDADGNDNNDEEPQDLESGDRGKAVEEPREQISVRARLSENGRDVQVTVFKSDTTKVLARKVADKANLPPNKRIRMAYMGKILKDNASLDAQGWVVGHVVNALVFDAR